MYPHFPIGHLIITTQCSKGQNSHFTYQPQTLAVELLKTPWRA